MNNDDQATDERRFYAHSTDNPDRSDWQLLLEHSIQVARQCEQFAAVFAAGSWGFIAGLLHDLGKYTERFQRRIAGEGSLRVDHATRGAIEAQKRYGVIGQLIAYAIAGHHAGLANGRNGEARTALTDRLRGDGLPPLSPDWQKEITLPDLATLDPPLLRRRPGGGSASFEMAFFTRMLYSCLVDADYLDTEAFYARHKGRPTVREHPLPGLEALRDKLDEHLAALQERAPDTSVNRLRADILTQVRGGAALEPGLFSLTVPTGGGKTLASMAFALDHALKYGLRRVIYVIPFTSIIEQNAKVFRKAFGDLGETAVLEHHSAFVAKEPPKDGPDYYSSQGKLRLAMENWDAPVIVTTAVQFFESLFAARSSACRKLHNIAGSVVILDEAQTLPLHVLRPCVAALDELARNYCVSVVLCTATQPALNKPDFREGFDNVRELAPTPAQLFEQLERVRVRHIGTLDDAALTAHLREREQVLCIVNNRKHARAVYQSISDLPGTCHLTTLMCAKHRSEKLDEIRALLDAGECCRLVSTSLIEAGVDVDFPTVLRAEAGLDSIAQAAGRCNREGKWLRESSEVLIFRPANPDWAPPRELVQFAQAAATILGKGAFSDQPLSPPSIHDYFNELYWKKGEKALDKENLLGLIADSRSESLPFETLAAKFRLIDDSRQPVIVPFDEDARQLLERLRHAEQSGGIARQLQRYLVQPSRDEFEALKRAGAIQPVAPEKWGEQFWELVNRDLYDEDFGLHGEQPEFIQIGNLIV